MTPPPTKKARKAGEVSEGISCRSSRRITRSQRPNLSPELIGRVASYANIGHDILNVCVSVGRDGANIVRNAYLLNNHQYLLHSVREKFEVADKIKCRSNMMTWMEVNVAWRDQCTEERIEWLKRATVADFETLMDENDDEGGNGGGEEMYILHPYVMFNNPAFAIEFGLLEPLKCMVEEKKIDVNAYSWTNFCSGKEPYHLVAVAMQEFEEDAFEYLLSQATIDANARVKSDDSDYRLFHLAFENRYCSRWFEAIVRHGSFDVNASPEFGGAILSPLHYAVFLISAGHLRSVDIDLWMEKFDLLLEAGADPGLDNGLLQSPLDVAKIKHADDPGSKVLKDAIIMMEDCLMRRDPEKKKM